MAVTADQFLDILAKSNLLNSDQLPASAVDPQETAKLLVQQGYLTRWQASQLLAGNHHFFLGKYKLLSKLGEGGMGAVYKAEQFPLKRLVLNQAFADCVTQCAISS